MRFLASKTGVVHVVDRKLSGEEKLCPVVSRSLNAGSWKGQRSIKPEEVLKMKDCERCETFKHARSEIRLNKRAKQQANAGVTMVGGRRAAKKGPVARNAAAQVSGDNWPVADERTTLKAKEHKAIAEEHGWTVTVAQNERRGLTIVAAKGDELCVLAYRENGILWNDEIRFKVPGRSVPMHNSGTWRRQVSLPEGQRPISARPKQFGRKKSSIPVEMPESANGDHPEDGINGEVIPLNVAALPFSKDDDDLIIVDAIKGMELFWRNNMMQKVVSARVPSKVRMIRFGVTGREPNQRRCVSFPESEMSKDGEIYGAERTVAIESMLRVRP